MSRGFYDFNKAWKAFIEEGGEWEWEQT
jgi:hypothetical protein